MSYEPLDKQLNELEKSLVRRTLWVLFLTPLTAVSVPMLLWNLSWFWVLAIGVSVLLALSWVVYHFHFNPRNPKRQTILARAFRQWILRREPSGLASTQPHKPSSMSPVAKKRTTIGLVSVIGIATFVTVYSLLPVAADSLLRLFWGDAADFSMGFSVYVVTGGRILMALGATWLVCQNVRRRFTRDLQTFVRDG